MAKKTPTKDDIIARARALADTGDYRDYMQIEFQLRHVEDIPRARQVLDNQPLRRELNARCQKARQPYLH